MAIHDTETDKCFVGMTVDEIREYPGFYCVAFGTKVEVCNDTTCEFWKACKSSRHNQGEIVDSALWREV